MISFRVQSNIQSNNATFKKFNSQTTSNKMIQTKYSGDTVCFGKTINDLNRVLSEAEDLLLKDSAEKTARMAIKKLNGIKSDEKFKDSSDELKAITFFNLGYAWEVIAKNSYKIGEIKIADGYYKDGLKYGGDSTAPQYLVQYGKFLVNTLRNYDEGIKYIERAQKIDPDNDRINYIAGELSIFNNPDKAITDLLKCENSKIIPKYLIYNYIGHAYERKYDLPNTTIFLKKALKEIINIDNFLQDSGPSWILRFVLAKLPYLDGKNEAFYSYLREKISNVKELPEADMKVLKEVILKDI